jgi:hypothetical protein
METEARVTELNPLQWTPAAADRQPVRGDAAGCGSMDAADYAAPALAAFSRRAGRSILPSRKKYAAIPSTR